jgi:tetratricopeptide (TPR) repeat protein
VPDLPAWWERAILRCLERRPDDRFPDAISVARALEKPVRPAVAGTIRLSPGRIDAAQNRSHSAPTPSPSTHLDAVYGNAEGGASSIGLGAVPVSAPGETGVRRATRSSPQSGTNAGSVDMAVAPASTSQKRRTRRRSMIGLMAALVLVLGSSAGLMWFNSDDGLDPSRVKPRRSVAVVGFQDLSGRGDVDWLSTALAEMVSNELARGEALRTLSGTRVAEARLEADLGPLHQLDEAHLARLHRLLGCDFVVSGSFVSLGGEGGSGPVRLDVELHDAAVGTQLATLTEQGAAEELFALVGRIGNGLREALGVGSDIDDPMSGVPRDPAANRLYAQALDALRDSQPERARDLLQQAVELEPDNALVHSALAAAWEAMGFSAKAVTEARLALDLVVEGRFRILSGEWTGARDVYRDLWQSFPDNLDYGLGLVDAQIGSHQIDEALATLEQLRQLPAPLSNDPRIDLAAARAAARGGRLELQKQAAERAAVEASRLGAEALLAQARLAQSQAQRLLGEPHNAVASATIARDIYQRLEHPEGHAIAATALANAQLDLGNRVSARAGYEEAVSLYRTVGDRIGMSASLNNLAVLLKKQGDLEGAQKLYAENETIFRELGDGGGLANTLNNQAVLLVERDRLAEALDLLERSKDAWQGLGPAALAYNLNNTAEVLRLQGRLTEARSLHQEALRLRRESGRKLDQLISQANLGGLLLDLGQIGEARQYLESAAVLAEEVGDPAASSLILFQRARLASADGDLASAAARHEEALTLRKDLAQAGPILASRLALARLDLDTSVPARAELLAREARTEAGRDGRRAEAVRASAVLIEALVDDQRPDEAAAASDEAEAYAEVETFEARLELDLARLRLSAARTESPTKADVTSALEAFEELATLAADHGLRPFALRTRLYRAEFVLRHSNSLRQDVLGRLRVLETESRAAGLVFYADWAAGLIPR